MHRFLAALLLIATVTGDVWAEAERVAIGVLVSDGERNVLERWSPTADYLTTQIPEHRFVIIPFNREDMNRAVGRGELDFIVTNPGHYVDLEATHGIVCLATIQHAWRDKPYAMFGAAVFTRADNRDIAWLSQIKGKSLMAVSQNDFDGFQLTLWELKAHDIDPFNDFSALIFSGLPSEEIVYAVRNGSVDVATVRTGVLERMASEGKINLEDFRVLHPHIMPESPFARSTELYPEWPFAKARDTADELAQLVASTLQTMPADHPAARAGGYGGWTVPLDYQPVQEFLRDLRLPPYDKAGAIAIVGIVHQYRYWLAAGFAFLLFLVGFATYLLQLNYRLRLSKYSLESEVSERERVEETLRRSEKALRDLHEITTRHGLPFESRVRALLAMGCQQFGLPIGILARIESDRYEVMEVMPADGPISKGSMFSLGQTYCCITLQTREPVSFEHAAVSGWRTHPAYLKHKLEAYLAIRVQVEERIYGTLNFSSPEPRTVSFTNADKEVLKLMAQWVGGEIHRKFTEARMRKLSGALEQTADTVLIADRGGVIEYVNPAFERATGYTREETIGKTPSLLRSDKHDAVFYQQMWQTILRGEVFHDTFINRRRDGVLYYEEKTITPLKDERGVVTHFVSTGKDVTSHKLAEERARQRRAQLAHVQRVSAMGVMATSLAHELNQPLAAIVNYAQGCIHRLRGSEGCSADLLPALEHIAAEGNRSGEIIRRVREFLRKGKPLRMRADINQIVRDAVDLVNPEARQKNIALRLELGDDMPLVLADAVQIEQVVLNLVHNAIEVIDEAQSLRREVIVQTHSVPKNGVEVIISDTGPGLPVRNSDRLFEPFFSTRPSGMGMGLSISRSIIEAHGDRLQALANADGGATFRFALPALEGGALQ